MDIEKKKKILTADMQRGIQNTKLQEIELERIKCDEKEVVVKAEIAKWEAELVELRKA